jgi:alpha-N-arabinofuranosidase
MEGNVFLSGAQPSKHEKDPVVKPDADPAMELVEKSDGPYLRITLGKALTAGQSNKLVTTELLGKAKLPNQAYTHADGTPLAISADFFGKARDAGNPAPGPFARSDRRQLDRRLWPKSR